MNKNVNNTKEFINRIFDRSDSPISQLERINSIFPGFFANSENVSLINSKVSTLGLELNPEYIKAINAFVMSSHPSCGSSDGYGHPSCGSSRGYGYEHPSCGSSAGYGHPSCCSSNNYDKPLLLVKKKKTGVSNGIRN